MSKLNKPGKNVANDIRAVAAKREQELGVSANGNLQFKKEPLQMLYELTVSALFGKVRSTSPVTNWFVNSASKSLLLWTWVLTTSSQTLLFTLEVK